MPLTMISKVFRAHRWHAGRPAHDLQLEPRERGRAAVRRLFGNPGAPAADAAWPIAHPVIATIGRSLLLLVTFMPLAAHRFQGGAS
jgi:ABC-2 type transport system permease protein